MLKQWVKILLANKDKNAAVIFLFISKAIAKLETETKVSQMLDNFHLLRVFDTLNNFMWVFVELAEFNFTWNRKIHFGINILK